MKKTTPEEWEGLFRRLNDAGCPVQKDHAYRVAPVGLVIEEPLSWSQSRVFARRDGSTGFALEFLLWNELDRRIYIQGCQIWPPWGALRLSLLPPAGKSSQRNCSYQFPGDREPYDEGGTVLNSIFARQKSWLNPNDEVEGVLLAVDELPIPCEFRDNARVTVGLHIFDSLGNRYEHDFKVKVDRSALRTPKAKERTLSLQASEHRKQEPIFPEYVVSR